MGDPSNINITWRSMVFAMLMFPAILCCIALLFRKTEQKSILWLIAFVLAVTVSGIPYLIGFSGAYKVWPGLTFLPIQLPLLVGPLLYLHTFRLLSDQPFAWRIYLLVPGFIDWVYQLWAFTQLGGYQAKWAFTIKFHDPYVVPVIDFFSIVLFIFSLVLIIKLQNRYKTWLSNSRSDDFEFEPIWLKHFLVLSILGGSVWLMLTFIDGFFDLSYLTEFWPLAFFHLLVLIFVIEALSRLHVSYPKLPLHIDLIIDEVEQTQRTEKRDWKAESAAIKSTVLSNNWHLETGFSLMDLAKRYGMNQSYVSRALNQGLGQNFSDFVNSLRIEHAKHLLDDSELKVLDVAMSSGFGSKASFNRVFKQHLGITPTQYKNKKVS